MLDILRAISSGCQRASTAHIRRTLDVLDLLQHSHLEVIFPWVVLVVLVVRCSCCETTLMPRCCSALSCSTLARHSLRRLSQQHGYTSYRPSIVHHTADVLDGRQDEQRPTSCIQRTHPSTPRCFNTAPLHTTCTDTSCSPNASRDR